MKLWPCSPFWPHDTYPPGPPLTRVQILYISKPLRQVLSARNPVRGLISELALERDSYSSAVRQWLLKIVTITNVLCETFINLSNISKYTQKGLFVNVVNVPFQLSNFQITSLCHFWQKHFRWRYFYLNSDWFLEMIYNDESAEMAEIISPTSVSRD